MTPTPYDAAVVGAGPGGSMAAYCLARDGHRVLLIDRAMFPRDKSCGDGLIRQSVELLHDAGLADVLAQARPADGVVLHVRTACGPLDGGQADRGRGGAIVRRHALDAALLERAGAAGAEIRQGMQVTHLRRIPGAAIEITAGRGDRTASWKARYVVGADGAQSIVARKAGLFRPAAAATGVARRGYFRIGRPISPAFHVYVPLPLERDHRRFAGYGWAFPIDEHTVNIGVGLFPTGGRHRFPSLPRMFDAFVAQLQADRALGDLTPLAPAVGGALPTGSIATRCHDDRVLLVGDAAGLVDPLTGEGIHAALWSGRIAADVVGAALTGADNSGIARYGERLERAFGERIRAGERFLRSYAFASRVIEESVTRDDRIFRAIRQAAFGIVDPVPAPDFLDLPDCVAGPLARDGIAAVCTRYEGSLKRVNGLFPKVAGNIVDRDLVGLRLAILFAWYSAAGGRGDNPEVVDVATAVELCALAFDVHASIVETAGDAAPPGATNTFALMTGDGLLAESYGILATLDDAVRRLVSDVSVTYCNHWLEQLRLRDDRALDCGRHVALSLATTGALFGLSARLGVMMAGGTPEAERRAAAVGEELGVVAGLMSDIRDALREPDANGSHPYRSDTSSRMTPYPVVWAAERDPSFVDLGRMPAQDLPSVLRHLCDGGAVEATRTLAMDRLAAVRARLLPDAGAAPLIPIADYMARELRPGRARTTTGVPA